MEMNTQPHRQTPSHRGLLRVNSLNTLDRLVMAVVDVMLIWGVSASFAYWLVLIFRWPVWTWYPALVGILGVLIHLLWRRFTWPPSVASKGWFIALLLVCIASASMNIFTNRPDGDDISFSHRALVAAMNLWSPIAMTDNRHDVDNLPPISPIHVFTSVEVTTALIAHAFGVPQLLALYMGLGSLTNFMLPAIYFLLLRFFRVRVSHAFLATVFILIFFVMSGNVHRDWGNFTILRSWQGKSILIEIILPLTFLYSLRFQLFGRSSDFIRLHAVTVCGIGLSGTGIFLLPFVIGTSAVASIIATRFALRSLDRGVQSASVLLEPCAVSVLPWLGILPKLGDISAYTQGWPLDCAANLALVFHAKSIPLYLSYLGTVFLVRRRIELYTFIICQGIALALLTMPFIGKLLMDIVTPGAYWRFSYALLVPLYAGLAVAGLSRLIARSGMIRVMGISWFVILVIATLVVKSPAINAEIISEPGPKFPHDILRAISEISKIAKKDYVVLAPESIAGPLGLLRPDIRFIVTRPSETKHAFLDAGRAAEGSLRSSAGYSLEYCDFTKFTAIDAGKVWPNVDLVVHPTHCSSEQVRTYFSLDSNWQDYSLDEYHALLRRGR